ncbi:MAG: hypothetical protein AB8F65_07945, partial [Woeseiaceae bacterium]
MSRRPARWQKAVFGLFYLLIPAFVLWLMYLIDQPYEVSDIFAVQEFEWVRGFSEAPPEHGWTHSADAFPGVRDDDDAFTSVWYRILVPATVENPSLYISNGLGNYDVWRNGQRLLQTAPVEQPLFFERGNVVVPLNSAGGDNERPVYLRVTREAAGVGAGYVFIAPIAEAMRDARELDTMQTTIPSVILAVMLSIAAAVGVMFLVRRKETAYGWYALTVLLWAVHTIHPLISTIPFHFFLWMTIAYLSLNWLVAELYFVNQYFGIPAPRLERTVTGFSMLVSVIFIGLAIPAADSLTVESWYYAFVLPISLWFFFVACIVTSRYFIAVRKRWDFDSVSLWLSSGVVVVVGIRDLIYENFRTAGVPGSVFYLQYVAVIPLILFGIQLLRRFARDAETAEMRNEELNELVEARSKALEYTYQRLDDEERKRVLAEERSRLMRDMHDGLGGQLVHALALSERGGDEDLQRSLRVALDDLRLIVDSLSPSENTLQDLLASYRHRVSRLLARTGFKVHWDIDTNGDSPNIRPKEALSILRVVQEAVTNAVRHSGGDV